MPVPLAPYPTPPAPAPFTPPANGIVLNYAFPLVDFPGKLKEENNGDSL